MWCRVFHSALCSCAHGLCDFQNAIREKNQALNYLRLSSRIDAVRLFWIGVVCFLAVCASSHVCYAQVAARVETAVRMNMLTKSMGGVVKGMDKVLGTMDVSKVT